MTRNQKIAFGIMLLLYLMIGIILALAFDEIWYYAIIRMIPIIVGATLIRITLGWLLLH